MIWRVQLRAMPGEAEPYIIGSFDTLEAATPVFNYYQSLLTESASRLELVSYEPGLTTKNFGRVLIREDIEK